MENASKALIMAGSILIALMIIGALLLMFNNLSSYQNTGIQDTREAQVIAFNNQFETYNRTNVRGSDLYSLLNRVVDYNRRKSTEGSGTNDEGQSLAYQPMTITFDLDGKINDFYATTDNSFQHLITRTTYTQSQRTNDFENDIKDEVDDLEEEYGEDSLNKLAIAKDKIFIANSKSDKEKKEAIDKFNVASKKVTIGENEWNRIEEGSTIRKDVYRYYEYIQFKRAKFNCEANSISNTSVEYNQQSGRIIRMNFKFTGRFE